MFAKRRVKKLEMGACRAFASMAGQLFIVWAKKKKTFTPPPK